jgi:pimeloyl-ACP methyl ester carboxylesterase
MSERFVGLPDGRAVAVAEAGDAHGWPVLFFHGFAGSRLQRHPDDGLATAAGYGSSRSTGRGPGVLIRCRTGG